MAVDASLKAAVERSVALQGRLLKAGIDLDHRTAEQLRKELTLYLRHAIDMRALVGAPVDAYKLLERRMPRTVESDLFPPAAGYQVIGTKTVLGVDKQPCPATFERNDGALFDFFCVVQERGREPLGLVAYRFQITFQDGTPAFLRWELDSHHEKEGLRSHLHPGRNRGPRVPSPVMQPIELLDLMVHGLRHDRN